MDTINQFPAELSSIRKRIFFCYGTMRIVDYISAIGFLHHMFPKFTVSFLPLHVIDHFAFTILLNTTIDI